MGLVSDTSPFLGKLSLYIRKLPVWSWSCHDSQSSCLGNDFTVTLTYIVVWFSSFKGCGFSQLDPHMLTQPLVEKDGEQT